MSDFKRIAKIYSEFADNVREQIPENTSPRSNTVEMLSLRYWFEGLKERTGLKTAYSLELYFEAESFRRNSNGTIRHYRSKWSRYEQNKVSSKAKTLAKVEQLAPGSSRDLHHPLWTLLKLLIKRQEIDFEGYFISLDTEVQGVLFRTAGDMAWGNLRREQVTQSLLEKLERRASLDSLAALIAIVVEADHLGRRALAVEAAESLHKVLSMLAIELQARGVAIGLIDWIVFNIFPLGVPAHLAVWMKSDDYIHASAHLNSMVFQHPERRGKSLPWKVRTRLMCKLLAGDMGIDVMYAMRPQFALRTDVGLISDDLVKEFTRASALRTWGWMCIKDGTPQVAPPTSLL
ncbi:hypothetical protein L6218_19075 [Pseudomonas syringae pv. syringae]|uniref:hypothetical protein n=1 Tax=Pseudomonas TaxID=286 RepID=UPI000CD09CA4|nr:hypothetical protein [Pseudomonas syringae]MCF4985176.1 hypothetical protein [Pseudomonas syringae]MCF5203373.1 hypothetical protein [Pseudomonas syringae]MCF5272821.1 hypothetical protein [Pseudomonas syringae]MCF5274431.1 hypothetical protein [Pseudomonas syringae]MCF5279329.1 hypothetical protein [Pseudomonas syringae]